MAYRIDEGQVRMSSEIYRCITGECEKGVECFVDGDQEGMHDLNIYFCKYPCYSVA